MISCSLLPNSKNVLACTRRDETLAGWPRLVFTLSLGDRCSGAEFNARTDNVCALSLNEETLRLIALDIDMGNIVDMVDTFRAINICKLLNGLIAMISNERILHNIRSIPQVFSILVSVLVIRSMRG